MVEWKTITTQVGSLTQTLYTAPRGTTAIVTAGTITNIGVDSDLSVHLVPEDAPIVPANKVLEEQTIEAGTEYLLETVINHALTENQSIAVSASTDGALNIRLTIKEIS